MIRRRDIARKFLIDFLTGTERDIEVLKQTAYSDGLTMRELREAANYLGVTYRFAKAPDRHDPRKGREFWSLP